MTSAREILDAAVTEAELQSSVEEYLTRFGWRWMHIPDRLYKMAAKARRYDALPGAKGFFDIVAMRDGVCLFIELKTMDGDLEADQVAWKEEVHEVEENLEFMLIDTPCYHADRPVQYHLWRPCDLSSGFIEAVLR